MDMEGVLFWLIMGVSIGGLLQLPGILIQQLRIPKKLVIRNSFILKTIVILNSLFLAICSVGLAWFLAAWIAAGDFSFALLLIAGLCSLVSLGLSLFIQGYRATLKNLK